MDRQQDHHPPALMTRQSQTQPSRMEPASSWAPPSALLGATPPSQVGTSPITETKTDVQGFYVAPWLGKRRDLALMNGCF